MPAVPGFIGVVASALRSRGAELLEPGARENLPNPFGLVFDGPLGIQRALVHVRRATPQHGDRTDHGRPPGEWHAQMIFDDSRRGQGVRNTLHEREGYRTVLFGFAEIDGAFVIAAWDARRKREYAYSRSLQIKDDTLLDALQGGVGQQEVKHSEIVAAFRPEFLPEYLRDYLEIHRAVVPGRPTPDHGENRPRQTSGHGIEPPEDFFGPRDRKSAGSRAVRDVRFAAFLADHYRCCAVCGIGVEAVLEAAHIVPVALGGSDHPSNGIRLCRNCHALFDNGLLLLTGDYEIVVTLDLERLLKGEVATYTAPNNGILILPRISADLLPEPAKLRATYDRFARP